MAKNNKMPVIRFSGYTNVWEQRKLNDFVTIRRGLTYKPSDIAENGIRVLRSSNIDEDQFIKSNDDVFVNIDAVNIPFAKNGDILITSANGSSRLVGKHTIINDIAENSTVHGGFMLLAESNNPLFTDALLSSNWYKRFINTYVAGGNGAIGNLSKSDLESQSVMVPSEHEQIKIGQWYGSINQLITLHQRKLEKLKLTKKALLQKLFPQNGSKLPELRFKGFTDAWEQRKFLDLLDAQNGIRRGPFGSSLKKDSFVKKSDYVVYEQQNAIYDNYETRYFISKEKYNELIRFNIQPGDFIMSGAGTIGRISMVPDGIKKGVFNQALIRFKVNKDSINPLYFLKFMQSDMMQKQLTQANPGSAMTNLVPMDELKKWDVTIPSLEEQNRISTFINQIDAFITLHHRKLEMLKNIKKGLLQKMFV